MIEKNNIHHHQHFACDYTGKIVDIKEAHTRRGIYTCPYCKSQMILKCGKVREWHFAHKPDADCDYNRYLHSLAEIKIRDWFNTSPSINIYLDVKREIECVNIDCCKFPNKESCRWEEGSVNKSFDLKAWYGEAVIEKKYAKSNEEFIADILCPCKKEGQDPLFIEIHVKHRCEDAKIKSGLKIIEIKISSEQDIEDIITGRVPLQENGHWKSKTSVKWIDSSIKFYGFQPKTEIKKINTVRPVMKFICYPSGGWKFINTNCKFYFKHICDFEVSFLSSDAPWEAFFAKAISKNYNPHQRIMCFNRGDDWGYGHICKVYKRFNLKKYCKENSLPCNFYQLDRIKYEKYIQEYEKLKNSGVIIEEWIK